MRDVAGDALVAQMREKGRKFTTNLPGFDARTLGLGCHSAEHWIGAHPDLRPCDVQKLGAWAVNDVARQIGAGVGTGTR